jgi:O-antigen ligase
MGRLSTLLDSLASAVPRLPTNVPTWLLLGPAGAGGLLMAALGGARTPLQLLVLFAVGASAVFVARSPGWAVVPLLIVDLSMTEERVPGLGLSLRLLVTLIATLCALAIVARTRSLPIGGTSARFVVVPAAVFVVVATVVNLLFSEIGFVVKYLRYQLVLVLTMALVIVLVRDRRALTIVTLATLATAVVSALVAIGQRIGGPLALYATTSSEVILAFGERVLGLSGSPVTLANTLVSVAVPAFGFLAVAWPDARRARLPVLLAALVVLVGVYLTTTRSALIAVAAGALVILAAVEGRRQLAVFGLVVVAVMVLGASVAVGLIDQRFLEGADEDKSAASHVGIMQVAFAVALDNLVFGIGREHFEQVSRAYESEVSVGGGAQAQRAGQGAVGALRPHNDFLEVWSSWGTVGLLAYLGIFAGALRNFVVARRAPDPLVRGLAVGCLAGLVAYGLNSFFHNYLDSSVILWCYAGLSAVLASMPASHAVRLAALRHRPTRWSPRSALIAARTPA